MTDKQSSTSVLDRVTNYDSVVQENLRPVADWFHEQEGELFERRRAVELVSEEFDLSGDVANTVLSNLVGDMVDPVVQVDDGEKLWVGIIDYHEHDYWYEYTEYHPVFGPQPKGVCGICVKQEKYDADVAYAMPGEGTLSTDDTRDEVERTVEDHVEEKHTASEVEVTTGASLVSGTTIASNLAIHKGNMTSEADANTVDGKNAGDLAPSYNDGSTTAYIVALERFGAEGSSTTNTSYQTIAGSDISFDPDEYKDESGNLYIRIKGHLKHASDSGSSFARIYRQNAASAVTGTEIEVSGTSGGWGEADSGWVDFGSESGFESYQLQLRSGDGHTAAYNSVLLFFGVPT